MISHSRLGPAVSALALGFVVTLGGCDTSADEMLISAESFEQGVAKDSEGGAFRVVLSTPAGFDEGLRVGENTLIVRLGFHDPDDPFAPGHGIPAAEVQLDAWMPSPQGSGGSVDGLRGVHVGDGRYEITGLTLPEPGVWQLDFALAIGENVDDSVSFAFVISD